MTDKTRKQITEVFGLLTLQNLLEHGKGAWLLALALVLMSFTLVFDEQLIPLFRYGRSELQHFELWRLVSAHIVHINTWHALMNMAALVLISLVVGSTLSQTVWLVVSPFIALSISFGLWFFSPEVSWYVGASGVLHGLLACGLLASLFQRIELWNSLCMGALIIKLVREQWPTFDIFHLQDVIGAAVVVDAHFYGAIAGAVAALAIQLMQYKKPRH